MQSLNKPFSLGVVVGRFQVPDLTPGHRWLIDRALELSDRLLIVVGCTSMPNLRNPLGYDTRKAMILEAYPQAEVKSIYDLPGSNQRWSQNLDFIVEQHWHLEGGNLVLFGGRDSFIPLYEGKFTTMHIHDSPISSGTSTRASVKEGTSREFREGAIWAVNNLEGQ